MAQLDSSVATLRISGDDLDPAEISALLGHTATKQQSRGEVLVGKVTGRARIAKIGMWRLEAADAAPENIDGQISEILNKPTHDRNVWKQLSMKYTIDLFCGLFMKVIDTVL